MIQARLLAFVVMLAPGIALADEPPLPDEPPPHDDPPPDEPPPDEPPPIEPPHADPPPVAPPAPPVAPKPNGNGGKVEVSAKAGNGVTFKAGDAFSLNVRARGQLRYQIHAAPPDGGKRGLDEVSSVSTMRLWLGGHTLSPRLLYQFQFALADRDFRDQAVSPIFDAYVEYRGTNNLNVRAGQFFVPFDRLRTVREFALQLGERPRPVGELTLDRDFGLVVFSERFANTPLTWRVGVFGGNGTNRSVPSKPGVMPTARLELRPLGPLDDDSEGDLERRAHPRLALGVGWATNYSTVRARSTSGATLGKPITYHHAAVDAVFKWHGFATQLEYLRRTASRDHFDVIAMGMPTIEYSRSGWGWVAQASYINDPPIEFVGRVSRLYADTGTDPKLATEVDNLGKEYAIGANYYLNGHQFKLQGNWIGRTGDVSRTFDHLFQVQIDFTF